MKKFHLIYFSKIHIKRFLFEIHPKLISIWTYENIAHFNCSKIHNFFNESCSNKLLYLCSFFKIYHILSFYKILQKKPYTKTDVHKRIDIKSNFNFKSPLLIYLVYIYFNIFIFIFYSN
jgi:hypothetical protein